MLPIQLSAKSGVPRYRQLIDQIAELIRSGQLAPGTQLPTVRDLATTHLVSLITVRRAYADLEAMELITRRQGQGTFVSAEAESASRRRALADAREVVTSAIVRARQLGLSGRALRDHVDAVLKKGET